MGIISFADGAIFYVYVDFINKIWAFIEGKLKKKWKLLNIHKENKEKTSNFRNYSVYLWEISSHDRKILISVEEREPLRLRLIVPDRCCDVLINSSNYPNIDWDFLPNEIL